MTVQENNQNGFFSKHRKTIAKEVLLLLSMTVISTLFYFISSMSCTKCIDHQNKMEQQISDSLEVISFTQKTYYFLKDNKSYVIRQMRYEEFIEKFDTSFTFQKSAYQEVCYHTDSFEFNNSLDRFCSRMNKRQFRFSDKDYDVKTANVLLEETVSANSRSFCRNFEDILAIVLISFYPLRLLLFMGIWAFKTLKEK